MEFDLTRLARQRLRHLLPLGLSLGACFAAPAQDTGVLPVPSPVGPLPPTLTQPLPGGATRLPSVGDQTGDLGRFRLQPQFPQELFLPPPTEETLRKEARLIPTTIEPELQENLVVGRTKVLQFLKTATRIYVSGDDIVRTELIDQQSGKEVALTGLRSGTTTLILWFDDPTAPGGQSTLAYEVRVYADQLLAQPTADLQSELNDKFPNSYIELDEIGGRLIVRGQAPDAIELSQILDVLVGARLGQGSGGSATAQETVFNTFNFTTPAERQQAIRDAEFADRFINPEALARAGIINQLKVVGEQQVMLKVTVAEVNRGAARSIGLNFSVDNSDGFNVFNTLTGGVGGGIAGGGAGGGLGGSSNVLASLDMGQVELAIEALRNLNLSRTESEPTVTVINGESANFGAGGSFPIPVISGGGGGGANLQGTTFVPFGVQLQVTPLIQDRDVIRLQLNASVSSRDESTGTSIGGAGGGTAVSGLSGSSFSTTVQLRSGQTIAVAGLQQSNFGASSDRIPFWGDLPFFGNTGGVNRTSSGEQELVILVTPYLVAPLDGCATPPLPGGDVHEPTDVEFFVANRLESRRSKDYRASVRTDLARQRSGESCCPEQFMVGVIGPSDRCCPRSTPVPHRSIPVAPGAHPVDQSVPAQFEAPGRAGDFTTVPVDNASFDEMIQRGPDVQ